MIHQRKKKVAILGATSHVAKNLIVYFANIFNLYLFARDVDNLSSFVSSQSLPISDITCVNIDQFEKEFSEFYDVVINCIGFGSPGKMISAGIDQFLVTEKYDNLILSYLNNNKDALYINFSSGAVYGVNHAAPVDDKTEFSVCLSSILPSDAYRISKLNSETKHRALPHFNIIDIRLFSFYSKFIEFDSKYLICDLVQKAKTGSVFLTDSNNIVRDYIHPSDLANLITLCIDNKMNTAIDTYSSKPVTKFELIDFFVKNYSLKFEVSGSAGLISPTGLKSCYCSSNFSATELLGYKPEFTSIEAIKYNIGKGL